MTTRVQRRLERVEPSSRDAVGRWLDVFVPLTGVRGPAAAELRDELEDHLRARVDDLMITGLSEPEATRRAVAELGETAALARTFRAARGNNRRRLAMHLSVLAVVGSAIGIGVLGFNGATAPNGMSGERPAAIAETTAPHDPDTKRYDVRELVFAEAPLDRSGEGASLIQTIVSLVQPETWEVNGGEARLVIMGNSLFIDAPSEVHEGVEWVLASLRKDAEAIRMAAIEDARRSDQERRRQIEELQATINFLEGRFREVLLREAQAESQRNQAHEAKDMEKYAVVEAEVRTLDSLSSDLRNRLATARSLLMELDFAPYIDARDAGRAGSTANQSARGLRSPSGRQ